MAGHRTHGVEFKRHVSQECLGGEILHGLAKRHDLSRNLIRVWVETYQAGALDAAKAYRDRLAEHGFAGSMDRRGNPYDNTKAESVMKTLKVEGVYPMTFETFADVLERLPRFNEDTCNARRLYSALGYLSPAQSEDQHARLAVETAA